MEKANSRAQELRGQIARAEEELNALKGQLARIESEGEGDADRKWPLRAEEYDRYGRQLILPGVGVEG